MSDANAKGQHEPSMEEILASIRRIIAEDNDAPVTTDDKPADPKPTPAPEPAAVASPIAAKEDDVLELTEVVEEEPPPPPAPVETKPEPEPEPEEPVMSIDAEVPERHAPVDTAERDRLLSDTTAAASVAALSQLVSRGPRDKSGELPLGAADRTLEDMVRELLRPMLKDWLDDHLPPLVERIVKDEVGRLVREAQGR